LIDVNSKLKSTNEKKKQHAVYFRLIFGFLAKLNIKKKIEMKKKIKNSKFYFQLIIARFIN
jgi:hypothetical protein